MEDPIGTVVRNLFTLQQLGTGITVEARPRLERLVREIVGELASVDPTEGRTASSRRRRVGRLMARVEELSGAAFGDVKRILRREIAEVGVHQAEWAAQLLQSSIGSVATDIRTGGRIGVDRILAIVDADPFGPADGAFTLAEWADTLDQATVRRVHQRIQAGMLRSETLDQIVRRVRGRSDGRGGFQGGVLKATTRDAESIVRTAVNFISNRGHLTTYAENADVIAELVLTATLDSRTSDICIALDGRTTSAEDPDPDLVPPFHFRCRTLLTPRVDWERFGIEPPPEGERASADGPVKASDTYEDWLRRQPHGVQDQILGAGRAQLFRDGKLNLRDLVTGDRRSRTVKELRAMAGLPPEPPKPPPTPARSFPPAKEVGARLNRVEGRHGPKVAREREAVGRLRAEARDLDDRFWSTPPKAREPLRARQRKILDELRVRIAALKTAEADRAAALRRVIARAPEDENRLVLKTRLRGGVEHVYAGGRDFKELVHQRWMAGVTVHAKRARSRRAYFLRGDIFLSQYSRADTVVHELGHAIEHQHPEIRAAARAWWAARTEGEAFQSLASLTGRQYPKHEVAKPDKFFDAYVGKIYPDNSEVVSMGLQAMVLDPVRFWADDPGHFEFIWQLMNGEIPGGD